ncbi:MAG TPA: hypothetical protein DCS93_17475 [Microscillaceae bacterium]|nr:hypothetical protein [Microscillaceae bacterium]
MIVHRSENIVVRFQENELHIHKSGDVPAKVFVQTLEKVRSFALKNKVTQWKFNYNPHSPQRHANAAPIQSEDLFETQQKIIARVNKLSDNFSRLCDQHQALKKTINAQ